MKKVFFILIGIVFFAVVGVLVLNSVAERKIKTFLTDKFDSEELVVGTVDANVLLGNIAVDSIRFNNSSFKIDATSLEVKDIHYWDFLVNDQLVVEKIQFGSPRVKHFQVQDSVNNPKKSKPSFKEEVKVISFEFENGTYISLGGNKKDTLFFAKNISGEINSLQVSEETISQKIPFKYGNYAFRADSLYAGVIKYHVLSIGDISVSNKNIAFQQLHLRPKYTRSEFRKIIPYEKDMYRLKIDSFEVKNPSFDLRAQNPIFESPLVEINGFDFKIYRDKTVPDDLRTKKMYSEMLRDLNFRLDISKMILKSGFIQYQELLKLDRKPGLVAFYGLNAVVSNLSNVVLETKNPPTSKVKIHTRFMNTSNLDVTWRFDVGNKREHFTISGIAKEIPPEAMNPFFVPAMHVRAEGRIDAVYFNFAGDEIAAKGDMKMDYDNFSVTVLKKNGEEKNKFLTAIANLFVKSSPKNGTIVKNGLQVKRDPTKSFWNYFWSCIEKGLLKSVL